MTKTKSTKRALLLSALSLLMCVSMLIGSTFAWFTDSVTSSGNKIQAGTLKLDLELLEKDGSWTSIKDSSKAIFDYDKWEPGYTEVKVLKVENEGNLALKWMAKFVSVNGLSDLANVIDVYVCPSETELAYPTGRGLEGYVYAGTVAEFVNTIETTTTGNLEAGEVAYLGIALKMQEEAGNEYQGMDLGGAFDIMIMATQLTAEEDSFDDQYDKDASYTAEVDSLKAKVAAAAYGDTVTVNLTHDAYIDSMIKVPNGVTLVLNGNGHQAIVNTAYPFYVHNANIQMNDLTITGKATYAIFTKGAIWDYNGNNATVNASFNNVTVDLDKADNYPVVFNGIGEITMTDCTITGAGLSEEGNYRNGTHIFAGAEIALTVDGGNVGNVLMNANYADNSKLTLNNGAVVEKLILASEQTKSAELVNNNGTVNELFRQVDNADKLKSTLESAAAGETVVVSKNIDMVGATVAVADGVKLMGDGDVTISNALFTVADDQSAAFTDIKFAGATTIEAKGDGRLSFVDCEFNVAPKKYNGFSRAAAIIGANQYYTIDLYLEGCTFNYQYTTGDADMWNAAIFMWSNVDDCVIKDCTFNGYGFMAVKLMNIAEGSEIILDGNTFNMCEASAANYFNNDAVQIMPQHDNTFSVVCTNNTFNGAYDQNTVVDIEGMSGLTLTKYTLTQSGNTINGEAATDANFEIQ